MEIQLVFAFSVRCLCQRYDSFRLVKDNFDSTENDVPDASFCTIAGPLIVKIEMAKLLIALPAPETSPKKRELKRLFLFKQMTAENYDS